VRYNLGTWLLTAIVAAVWLQSEGLPWLDRKRPGLRARWMRAPWLWWLAGRIRHVETALNPAVAKSEPASR
jgi:hypothetical protein